jgi:hypothetical protein
MSLIVETGAGAANSESYASVAQADLYLANRGLSSWDALDDDVKEASLRKATDYMLAFYRPKWKGRRVLITQALDWPRVGVVLEDFGGAQGRNNFGSYGLFQVDYTTVPVPVINATCELALRASVGELAADLDRETLTEGVSGINVTYRAGTPQYIRYRLIELMLRPYLMNAGATLVRA